MAWFRCMGSGGSPTPTNLVPVITANGNQYVNLPIYSDDNDELVIKFKVKTSGTGTALMGSDWNVDEFLLQNHTENNEDLYLYYTNNNVYTTAHRNTGSGDFDTFDDVEVGYGYLTVNGVKHSGASAGTISAHHRIQLFADGNGSHQSSGSIGEIEIFKNGDLSFHLVPSQKANGDGCFIDVLNGDTVYESATATPLVYSEITGEDSSKIIEKRYARFTSAYGLRLPDKFGLGSYMSSSWNLSPKIVLKIFATEYRDETVYMHNNSTSPDSYSCLREYNNKFYGSYGSSSLALTNWSSGEHTYVENDDDGYISFDGTQYRTFSPSNRNASRFLGPSRNQNTPLTPSEVESKRSDVCLGYFMSLKIYDKNNNNELVFDVVPATFNNIPYLYDKVEQKLYYVPELIVTDTTPTIPNAE